jgi:hypothetical protein
VGRDCRGHRQGGCWATVWPGLAAGCYSSIRAARKGSVPAVWGSLLGLALPMALNPALLGITILVISRPRPVQNLLACWVGCLITNVPALLVPLMVLHVTPMFSSTPHDLAAPATGAGSTVRHIQIGMGVLALSIAALMTVRFWARRRPYLPTPGGNTSTLVLDSNTPTTISRPRDRAQDAATEGGSAIRRLLGRAHNAWENGSLWVSLVIGMVLLPGPPLLLFVVTTIVASGAAIATQVSAAIAFVVGTLAVFEITLVSYLVAPAKTQAVVQLVHDWALAHRRKILVAIFAVAGVSLVANGTGIV